MRKIISIILVVLVVTAGVYVLTKDRNEEAVFCTADARMCPDGSYVGRTGPNCEFSACPKVTQPTTVLETAVLGVGETKLVNGVSITINKIVEDSRCRVDVQCVWAGRLVVNVTLKTDKDTETLDFDSGKKVFIDTYTVSLEDVAPPKKTDKIMPDNEYQLTFRVVRN